MRNTVQCTTSFMRAITQCYVHTIVCTCHDPDTTNLLRYAYIRTYLTLMDNNVPVNLGEATLPQCRSSGPLCGGVDTPREWSALVSPPSLLPFSMCLGRRRLECLPLFLSSLLIFAGQPSGRKCLSILWYLLHTPEIQSSRRVQSGGVGELGVGGVVRKVSGASDDALSWS